MFYSSRFALPLMIYFARVAARPGDTGGAIYYSIPFLITGTNMPLLLFRSIRLVRGVEKGRKTRNEVPRHKFGCFRSIHGVIYHPSLIYYFLFLTRRIEEFSLAICSVSLARCSVSYNVRDRNETVTSPRSRGPS